MEGDAGTSRLNPTDPATGEIPPADASTDVVDTETTVESTSLEEEAPGSPPSRMSRAWFVSVCAVLLLLTAGLATGGYFALRAHDQNAQANQDERDAMKAAKDCVMATNAPDPATMAKSVQKILDCSTGDFGAYAKLMAPVMVDAYQAANTKVEVTTMRAAAEKVNDDGTIEVLVAWRFKVPTNPDQQNQETGLRMRAKMKYEDGKYKIDKLEQVMS
jgi:Mce-associated membrane protein